VPTLEAMNVFPEEFIERMSAQLLQM
jgi:hypothetical protein